MFIEHLICAHSSILEFEGVIEIDYRLEWLELQQYLLWFCFVLEYMERCYMKDLREITLAESGRMSGVRRDRGGWYQAGSCCRHSGIC